MATIEKLIAEGKLEMAAQLNRLAGMNGYVFISDKNNTAYESGLALWLQVNCEWEVSACGFTATIKK